MLKKMYLYRRGCDTLFDFKSTRCLTLLFYLNNIAYIYILISFSYTWFSAALTTSGSRSKLKQVPHKHGHDCLLISHENFKVGYT
jgi:hypothetical protein